MRNRNSPAPPDPALAPRIRAALDAGAELLAATGSICTAGIAALAAEWTACLAAGGKILLLGNGGSQADAQHLAGELVNRFRRDRRALPALALGTSSPVLTSVANDGEFAAVFAREVEAFGRPPDLVVGMSTSGQSPNVVRALETARRLGLRTEAFTGAEGGPVGAAADTVLAVPSRDTPLIQQAHLAVGHILCDLVEERLFPASGAHAP
ncbi:MAG: SIS domain-containing protein [Planctomycetes bacterium]|nr:SIS domain-containing protein [Planctomycetota bacterium]